jgi:hypothetical protein
LLKEKDRHRESITDLVIKKTQANTEKKRQIMITYRLKYPEKSKKKT